MVRSVCRGMSITHDYLVERILKRHATQHVTKVESGPRPSKEEQVTTSNVRNSDLASPAVVRTPGSKQSGKNASSESTTLVDKFPDMFSPPPLSRANNARLGEY
jgi:hypothetical protein